MAEGGFICCLVVFMIIFLAGFITFLVLYIEETKKTDDLRGAQSQAWCPSSEGDFPFDPITVHSDDPKIFDQLTTIEMNKVMEFMQSPTDATGLAFVVGSMDAAMDDFNVSFIDFMTLLTPNKASVLSHTDDGRAPPPRYALVAVVHNSYDGTNYTSEQLQYNVGPLSGTNMTAVLNRPIPKLLARFTDVEEQYINRNVFEPFFDEIKDIMNESYQTNWDPGCNDKFNCIADSYIMPNVDVRDFADSTSVTNQERKTWFFFMRKVDNEILHPVGLQILVNHDVHRAPNKWFIDAVWYNFKLYNSAKEFVEAYRGGSALKGTVPVVTNDTNLYSSMRRRTPGYADSNTRGSEFYLPVGRGFSINGGQITWRKWSMNYNLHPVRGLALFDVRWDKTRIVYEISLQEVAVEYSGFSPMDKYTAYLDSHEFLGLSTSELMPGVDCPNHASLIDIHVFKAGKPTTIKNGVCIFEWNNAMPLKRHFHQYPPSKYDGMETNALVVRSMIAVYNYDYELDYVFFPTGNIEVKVTLIGYVQADLWHQTKSKPYGLQIAPQVHAIIHNHLAHFKVDIDVLGTANRYSQWTAVTESEQVGGSSELYDQENFKRYEVRNENESDWHYDFRKPSWHLYCNNRELDELGNHRCWEIAVSTPGMNMRTKSFYRPAFSFSYQQLATTVRKEQEESSSSTYNAGCPMHPDVDFSKFLDNESLLDQDLVTWVTLGKWHIPKREDLPVVTTPGHTMNFIIKPFNYFPEDPSMDSSHNIRFEQTEEGQVEKTQDNRDSSKTCIAPSINDYVFSFSGVKEEEIGGQEIPDETSPQTITNETSPQTITDQKNTQNIKDEFYFD